MPTTTSRATILEAVNQMLAGIGEAPIQNLVDEANEDSLIAQATLDEVCRELSTEDWWFNREREVKFTPDAQGHIEIPETMVTVESHFKRGALRCDYTVRSGRLYNLDENTDEFTQDVYLDVVYLLEWEDLPVAAQVYVTARATRKLADRLEKHGPTHQNLREDEAEARVKLTKADTRVFTPTLLDSDMGTRYQGGRRRTGWDAWR